MLSELVKLHVRVRGRFRSFDKWAPRLHGLLASGRRADAAVLGRALVVRWHNSTKCHELPRVLFAEISPRALKGFCPFGYAAAARAASWIVRRSPGGSRKRRELLESALACAAMGERWWTWNFHSDTRWKAMLAPLSLAKELALLRWTGLTTSQPTARGDSDDLYLDEYRKQLHAALAHRLPEHGGSFPVTHAQKLRFAGFGVHTTTLLEPMFALKKILPEEMQLEFMLFGATHPPSEKLLHEVCSPGAGRLTCQLSYLPAPDWRSGPCLAVSPGSVCHCLSYLIERTDSSSPVSFRGGRTWSTNAPYNQSCRHLPRSG